MQPIDDIRYPRFSGAIWHRSLMSFFVVTLLTESVDQQDVQSQDRVSR